jgi:hypothetical protein
LEVKGCTLLLSLRISVLLLIIFWTTSLEVEVSLGVSLLLLNGSAFEFLEMLFEELFLGWNVVADTFNVEEV